jgi:hypothetical protein
MIELINVKGWPQNASHFNFEEFIPEEDASLVKVLRDAGASKSPSCPSSSTSLPVLPATSPTTTELVSLSALTFSIHVQNDPTTIHYAT